VPPRASRADCLRVSLVRVTVRLHNAITCTDKIKPNQG
jgi:hypothetical protein